MLTFDQMVEYHFEIESNILQIISGDRVLIVEFIEVVRKPDSNLHPLKRADFRKQLWTCCQSPDFYSGLLGVQY